MQHYQLSLTGLIASLRFYFAFFGVDERYGELSPDLDETIGLGLSLVSTATDSQGSVSGEEGTLIRTHPPGAPSFSRFVRQGWDSLN